MKPYRELSGRGQTQRLKRLAIEALKAYDLQIESIAQLVHFNNTTFRLKDRRGRQYVLRINRPLFHDRKAIESEIRWMSALRGDLGLSTPEIVSSAAGALTVKASAEGVPEARDVVIFRWLHGRFRNRLSPAYIHKAGRTLARIHKHGASWRRPRGFTRKTWDADMMLYGEPGTDGSGIRKILNARDWDIFEQTADHFREATDVLGSSSEVFGLIHGDFHHGNFLSQGNEIAVLDFDDCGFGTFAYDIAVLLSIIIRRPNFPELRPALLDGYRSIRPFPEAHERYFGCMVAMRWIMLAVWKAGVYDPPALHGDAEVFAKQRVKDIRERSLHKQDTTI